MYCQKRLTLISPKQTRLITLDSASLSQPYRHILAYRLRREKRGPAQPSTLVAAQAELGNLCSLECQPQFEVERVLEIEAGQCRQRTKPLSDWQHVQIVRQVERAEHQLQPALHVVDALSKQCAASERLIAPALPDRRPLIFVEADLVALKLAHLDANLEIIRQQRLQTRRRARLLG